MSTSDIIETELPIGAHHHRAYVGPPEKYDLIGAMQFNLLTLLGLRENHFLLDVGCGSLRAGKLLIPYLLPSHYFGIEPERWLVEEGIKNELGQEIIRIKKPVFGFNSHFDCDVFEQTFDFVIAQSVFSHASQGQIFQCLSNVSACMRPGGVWAATFVSGSSDYQGQEWVYPECVTYTVERMKQLAAGSGLDANLIDWPHPNGQSWLLFTRPGNANVPSSLWSRQKAIEIRQKSNPRLHSTIDTPTCIIGMHRSGTSMVARLLNQCGLNLGPKKKLMGPNADNAMGHFEHTGFLEIDDALLKHFGGSWDNPPILNSGWEHGATVGGLVAKAEKLIGSFANSAPWGWKEPRTTLLLPFWQKLLPDLRYVICVRNPLEVARSLAERDGTSIPEGAQLWSRYTCAAIRNTEGWPRILTFYEDFFKEPLDEINRVVGFCRLNRVDDPSKVQEIISGELRHQTSGTAELLNEGSVPLECKVLYLGLRLLALEERCTMEIDDSTKSCVPNGIGKVLSVIDEFHDQEKTLQLETALCVREYQLRELGARMRAESREKSEQISQLQNHNDRLRIFADAVRQTLAYRLYKTFIRPFRRSETLR